MMVPVVVVGCWLLLVVVVVVIVVIAVVAVDTARLPCGNRYPAAGTAGRVRTRLSNRERTAQTLLRMVVH